MERVRRIDRTLFHKASIFELYKDKIQVTEDKCVEWDFIKHRGAAAVLPVLENGRILMVRQFREAIDRDTLEIPAGGLNSEDEPTIEAAARELEEETGFKSAGELKFLISVRTAPAYCNEKIDVYIAKNLIKTQQKLDEGEYIRVEEWDIDDLVSMIYDGKIQDCKTIGAILAYKLQLQK
ncbi:MAG: NUDIX hydrolase [Lachnospiraceae bacterium]